MLKKIEEQIRFISNKKLAKSDQTIPETSTINDPSPDLKTYNRNSNTGNPNFRVEQQNHCGVKDEQNQRKRELTSTDGLIKCSK